MPLTRRRAAAATASASSRKSRGGLRTPTASLRRPRKRLVDPHAQTQFRVYGQGTPDESFFKRTWSHFKKTTLLSYQAILRGVVREANALQTMGYKVTNIQGATKKPVSFVDDTATPFHKRNHLWDLTKGVFERTTEFTIYFRKYESKDEPLARPIYYRSQVFSFYNKAGMRKHVASLMDKVDVLCQVDIHDTGVLQDSLMANRGDLRATDTRVILFFHHR
jgi:hypothetical protein